MNVRGIRQKDGSPSHATNILYDMCWGGGRTSQKRVFVTRCKFTFRDCHGNLHHISNLKFTIWRSRRFLHFQTTYRGFYTRSTCSLRKIRRILGKSSRIFVSLSLHIPTKSRTIRNNMYSSHIPSSTIKTHSSIVL